MNCFLKKRNETIYKYKNIILIGVIHLSDRIYELSKRIRNLEEELIEVKKELHSFRMAKDSNNINADIEKEPTKKKVKPKHNVVRNKEPKGLEQAISDWLPRIFIFVFILGIIWAFVAAAEMGWFGPGLRVMFGFGLTGLLYYLGNKQYKQNKNTFSIVLLGGSIIIYIISLFAANVLYGIIPYIITVFLLGVGMYAGVWMSRKYQSQSLLAIIGTGAYFYPFIFIGDSSNEFVFYLYETLLFVGLVLESSRKQYKVTWNIANYAFIFTIFLFSTLGIGNPSIITFITLLVQQIVVVYLTYKDHNPISKEMYIPAITTGAFVLFFVGQEVFNGGMFESYLFYLFMGILYFVVGGIKGNGHRELKNIFFAISMFYLFLLVTELFADQGTVKLIVYLIQSSTVYYISQKRKSILGTIGSLLILLPVIGMLFEGPGYILTASTILCWILTIGYFVALYVLSEKSVVLGRKLVKNSTPFIISLLVIVLFGKVSFYLTDNSSYMFQDIGLSISWMVFVGVMYAAYSFFKDKKWNYIGLAFLFITLAKITLYDLATVDIVWRAILFIILGVIGLLISKVFYNKNN